MFLFQRSGKINLGVITSNTLYDKTLTRKIELFYGDSLTRNIYMTVCNDNKESLYTENI